jgi:hypothetical protein
MRSSLAAAALICFASASPVLANCSTEVALAVRAQGKQTFLRKETRAIGESGPFKMTVEYHIPERMRQVVTPLTENKSVEAIVIGNKAWTNNGDGWVESPPNEAQQLEVFMSKTNGRVFQDVGKFECLGLETVNGRKLRAYRGINQTPTKKNKDGSTPPKNEAVRIVYLDPETGLPARSIFAQAGNLKNPLFEEIYTYPDNITIDAPKNAKKFNSPKAPE